MYFTKRLLFGQCHEQTNPYDIICPKKAIGHIWKFTFVSQIVPNTYIVVVKILFRFSRRTIPFQSAKTRK